jgi:hypothetical protein
MESNCKRTKLHANNEFVEVYFESNDYATPTTRQTLRAYCRNKLGSERIGYIALLEAQKGVTVWSFYGKRVAMIPDTRYYCCEFLDEDRIILFGDSPPSATIELSFEAATIYNFINNTTVQLPHTRYSFNSITVLSRNRFVALSPRTVSVCKASSSVSMETKNYHGVEGSAAKIDNKTFAVCLQQHLQIMNTDLEVIKSVSFNTYLQGATYMGGNSLLVHAVGHTKLFRLDTGKIEKKDLFGLKSRTVWGIFQSSAAMFTVETTGIAVWEDFQCIGNLPDVKQDIHFKKLVGLCGNKLVFITDKSELLVTDTYTYYADMNLGRVDRPSHLATITM